MFNSRESLHSFVDQWRHVVDWRLWLALLGVAVLLAASVQITYSTGGTRNAYLHIAYIPIALAAALFRVPGGLVAGLAAGLLLGPLMPLDVEDQLRQSTRSWLYRMGFFMLIGAFIGQLSHMLNARLDELQASNENLSRIYAHTLRAFTSIVSYRDAETAGHCDRVAQNARVLGESLGLPRPDLNELYWAGILHDLGKLATPTNVLLKPGPLTDAEFEEIKRHAAIGADLLGSVSEEFERIADGVLTHHERWDGHGYPQRLEGYEIPLFGRILAVVDVFEALTSKRPYRAPLQPDEALAHISREAGEHFDPQVVRVFLQAYDEGKIFVIGHSGGSDESGHTGGSDEPLLRG